MNAGPTGALFGSVTATNVADRLWEEQKLRVDRRKLQMETIKRIGRYTVPFEVFADVVAELRLVVAPEGQELPPEAELAALEEAERAEAAAEAEAAAAEESRRRSRVEEAIAEEDEAAEDEAAGAGSPGRGRAGVTLSSTGSPPVCGRRSPATVHRGGAMVWNSPGSWRKERPFRPLY